MTCRSSALSQVLSRPPVYQRSNGGDASSTISRENQSTRLRLFGPELVRTMDAGVIRVGVAGHASLSCRGRGMATPGKDFSCADSRVAVTLGAVDCAASVRARAEEASKCPPLSRGSTASPLLLRGRSPLDLIMVSASAIARGAIITMQQPLSDRGLHLHLHRRPRTTTNAGRPGRLSRRGPTAPNRGPTGSSPTDARHRHRAGRLEDRQGSRRLPHRPLACPTTRRRRHCWRPSATAAPSTASSIATPATPRAAASAAAATTARWPRRPAGASRSPPALGRMRSSARCPCSGPPECRCPTRS